MLWYKWRIVCIIGAVCDMNDLLGDMNVELGNMNGALGDIN